jgi:hypothetical protein
LEDDPISRTLRAYRQGINLDVYAAALTATNPHYVNYCGDGRYSTASVLNELPVDFIGEDHAHLTLPRRTPNKPILPRKFLQHQRATINVSTKQMEVVASDASEYFEKMDGDVLEEHVLVYEGKSLFAVPIDTKWVDSDRRSAWTNPAPTLNENDGFGFDGLINQLQVATHDLRTTQDATYGTSPLMELAAGVKTARRQNAQSNVRRLADEYLTVLGGLDNYNDKSSSDEEYINVVGGDASGDDDSDNDYLAVMGSLSAINSSSTSDEYLSVADLHSAVEGSSTSDEYLEVNGNSSDDDDTSQKRLPGRLSEIWQPTGAVRAPTYVFKKGSSWGETTKTLNLDKRGGLQRTSSSDSLGHMRVTQLHLNDEKDDGAGAGTSTCTSTSSDSNWFDVLPKLRKHSRGRTSNTVRFGSGSGARSAKSNVGGKNGGALGGSSGTGDVEGVLRVPPRNNAVRGWGFSGLDEETLEAPPRQVTHSEIKQKRDASRKFLLAENSATGSSSDSNWVDTIGNSNTPTLPENSSSDSQWINVLSKLDKHRGGKSSMAAPDGEELPTPPKPAFQSSTASAGLVARYQPAGMIRGSSAKTVKANFVIATKSKSAQNRSKNSML